MTQTKSAALAFESLENRTLLAVALPADAVAAESDRDPIIVEEVQLRVGDRDVTVSKRNDVVLFKPGESIEVVGISYAATSEAETLDGVVAFEGFLRHGDKESVLGSFDYRDGRFGDPASQDSIVEGVFAHDGLEGGWNLDENINRMSLALVRYFGDSWQTHDRFFVNLQAGETDLGLLRAVAGRTRDGSVMFGAAVLNRGVREFSTYSEVDVYRAEDLESPVWVGVSSMTIGAGRVQLVRYSNSDPDDAYDKVWRPDASGEYVARFYLDPENSVLEQNEENNFVEYRFRVKV